MDENYKLFISEMGQSHDCRNVNEGIISHYSGKVSSQLLQYWREYGWCGYAKGAFWTVNPNDYTEVVDSWLKHTHFYTTDQFYVIARTAFGELYLWGTLSGDSILISSPYNQIFPDFGYVERMKQGSGDFLTRTFFSTKDLEEVDLEDESGDPMFERALKKLGPLAYDEMYGFEPALVLGGRARLENLTKVKIIEHLLLLSQLDTPGIMENPYLKHLDSLT